MMKRKITAIVMAFTLFTTNVSASILGSKLIFNDETEISKGTKLYTNTFISDQKGVGKQTEYYAEYTPNNSVVPIVVTGEEIYGKRTAKEAINYMKNNNMVPMIGINASFFSTQTGIPMGHVVTDGVVTSKDDRVLKGIGFKENGEAFIDDMLIQTSLTFGDDYVLEIPHINKFIFENTQMTTLFTKEFGKKTGTSTQTINVIIKTDKKIKIGEEFKAIVEDVITTDEQIEIGENQMILSINTKGNPFAINLFNQIKKDEEITIKTTANSQIWNDAKNALASEGAQLLKGSQVATGLESGSAPRTCVGIKADGTVIFYVLDGRQTGYSYGAKQETVAKRLLELGCVDAINLDGGGSTTVMGVYPGCDEYAVINSPSDKTLRKVTNFIFLQNIESATKKLDKLFVYPKKTVILSGSTFTVEAKGTDENFYPVGVENVEYSANEYANVEKNQVTALGEGQLKVFAKSQGIQGVTNYDVYMSPDDIKLYNNDNNNELKYIQAKEGDTFNLKVDAFYNGIKMVSSPKVFKWSVSDEEMATVNNDGVLKINEYASGTFYLNVTAGEFTKTFEIRTPVRYVNFYPVVNMAIDDNTLVASLYCEKDGIDIVNSLIKIDGKNIDFSNSIVSNDGESVYIEYKLPDDFIKEYHKISCVAVSKKNNAQIAVLTNSVSGIKNIFKDTNSHWAKNTISYMNSQGIVNGQTEGGVLMYKPNNNVTRAEFAIMVSNMLGYNTKDYKDISLDAFYDKDKIPAWAKDYVKAVYKNGIINGKDNNGKLYFEPDSFITRQEAVTIMSRILPKNLQSLDIAYSDKTDISAWATDAFKILCTQGLISGYEDNTLKPKNNVTRAEAITMLYNIY